MQHYVAGFMFRANPHIPSETEVALVRKDHPEWQRGKLNGIGGQIKPEESTLKAMVREFQEETGCQTDLCDWRQFCELSGTDWKVHFFVCWTGLGRDIKQTESEWVGWIPISRLGKEGISETIPNLSWLIPMALDTGGLASLVWETLAIN